MSTLPAPRPSASPSEWGAYQDEALRLLTPEAAEVRAVVTDEPEGLRALRTRCAAMNAAQVETECRFYRRVGDARYLAFVKALHSH